MPPHPYRVTCQTSTTTTTIHCLSECFSTLEEAQQARVKRQQEGWTRVSPVVFWSMPATRRADKHGLASGGFNIPRQKGR